MSFQAPINNPLTETQDKLLAQMGAIKSLIALPKKSYKSLTKDKMVSAYDYLIKLALVTVGPVFVDSMLNKYLDKVFNPANDKLERAIIGALGKSLDKQGKKISASQTNKQWLEANALPAMRVGFTVAKALIAKQIITMLFGPKEAMRPTKPDLSKDSTANVDSILNSVVCSEDMFTVSNNVAVPDGDLEFNTVKLRERLEKGEVQFVISCQTVKIKLPEQQLNNALADIVKNNSNPNNTPQSSVAMFNIIDAHVGAEVQRINSQENKNAVRKSMLETIVEKMLSLITPAIEPYLGPIFDLIAKENPELSNVKADVIPSPCAIRNLAPAQGAAESEEFKRKALFSSVLMNALYSLLLSMLLAALIKQIKKLIRNALANKARAKIQRKTQKMQSRAEFLDKTGAALDKAAKMKAALASLDDVYNFLNLE